MKDIYLAGGCFWGSQKFLDLIDGVVATEVGYANGKTQNPSYEEVCTQQTGHAETVQVQFDETRLPLADLLWLFFQSIDPTTVNRQGGDTGPQYRTGIYYTHSDDGVVAQNFVNSMQQNYNEPIAVEVKPLENFYTAEEYHQKYLDKTPGGYCHISPAQFAIAKKGVVAQKTGYSKPALAELKQKLTPMQYNVTQENGTEPPFENEYWNNHQKGLYVDITTGEPLFTSRDKFDSGCGWPSFTRPLAEERLEEKIDTSHGMSRTEVRSKAGDAHLGHVFTDGPVEEGGLRYCINSAALRFIPVDEMEKEGYGEYIDKV